MASTLEVRAGMGCIPHADGCAFRVWAPHAEAVSVVGDFNDWAADAAPMTPEENGYWYVDSPQAKIGSEYLYRIRNSGNEFTRIDPYARHVTNSIGNGVVHDPAFDWGDDAFTMPPVNELIIYELHVGTFNAKPDQMPGALDNVTKQFEHLRKLGVNAVELMPIAEFAGDYSWGYNPAHIFAVESAYGGPQAFKRFVKAAHEAGLAVILDVVYNHFGPSDLSIWQFDGWSENGKGGIYFYNDWRSQTPWGDTRPDYGRPEVRQYIRDNALMWLEEYRVDGLRMDMTLYMRQVRGDNDPGAELPDGWGLIQWINRDTRERFPRKITIAEDLRDEEYLTKTVGEGGAGYNAQWSAAFVHPIRAAVIQAEDQYRSMDAVRAAILHNFNGDPFQRVVYSESHDEVANGKARVPHEVDPGDTGNWFAQKRSTLAAALVLTAPGIPMLFQGQEFLQGGWFDDGAPVDWDLNEQYRGVVRLYRDLIALRLNRSGISRGLCGWGVQVHHVNESQHVLAFHRWERGGAGDDVLIFVNLANGTLDRYRIGFPAAGMWKLRFNSDWEGYSNDFGGVNTGDVSTNAEAADGMLQSAALNAAPYSVLIFSQDR